MRLYELGRRLTRKNIVGAGLVVNWGRLGMVRWILWLALVVVGRLVEQVVRQVDDDRNCYFV